MLLDIRYYILVLRTSFTGQYYKVELRRSVTEQCYKMLLENRFCSVLSAAKGIIRVRLQSTVLEYY